MSASGGFYTYRCKYFYTHNCLSWVYTNNAPCPSCLVSIYHFEQLFISRTRMTNVMRII